MHAKMRPDIRPGLEITTVPSWMASMKIPEGRKLYVLRGLK